MTPTAQILLSDKCPKWMDELVDAVHLLEQSGYTIGSRTELLISDNKYLFLEFSGTLSEIPSKPRAKWYVLRKQLDEFFAEIVSKDPSTWIQFKEMFVSLLTALIPIIEKELSRRPNPRTLH